MPRPDQIADIIHEAVDIASFIQIKLPSLSDYDHEGTDDEDGEVRLCLERWGDRRVPA